MPALEKALKALAARAAANPALAAAVRTLLREIGRELAGLRPSRGMAELIEAVSAAIDERTGRAKWPVLAGAIAAARPGLRKAAATVLSAALRGGGGGVPPPGRARRAPSQSGEEGWL
ncbi:MAG: hypothetical protein L0027_06085 [Candidatus Rokubacteria bacterium]|nr:hypothetical protein [Candidatus Rokubacteria bacterium]